MNFRFRIPDARLRRRGGRPGAASFCQSKSGNQKSKVSRAARGFTLIEVLVALAVFALAVVVLGSAYLNVLNSYETVTRGLESDEDFAFARHLVLTESDRTKLEKGGEFDTAGGRRARWAVEIASTNLADLFKVTFTCEIPDPARLEPEKVVQTFVVLRPTWSIDPAERSKLKEATKTRIFELQGKQAK